MKLSEIRFNAVYNNQEALEYIDNIMKQKLPIHCKLILDTNNHPAYEIESSRVWKKKLFINPDIDRCIHEYLKDGETDFFGIDPNAIEPVSDNYILERLKLQTNIQRPPHFREYGYYINGFETYNHGMIFYKMKRTQELVELINNIDL